MNSLPLSASVPIALSIPETERENPHVYGSRYVPTFVSTSRRVEPLCVVNEAFCNLLQRRFAGAQKPIRGGTDIHEDEQSRMKNILRPSAEVTLSGG